MKIHALAILAFITASGVKAQVVENPCVICPNGVNGAGDDFILDFLAPDVDAGVLNFTTCKEFIEKATLFETGTHNCAVYGFYEAYCCPPVAPPQDPCTVCPNGVTVADDIATDYYCSDLITGVPLVFESESDTCTMVSSFYEFFCCPEIDGGTATTTTAPAVETGTSTNATASPEVPVEETSTYATATAIPEIDGGTATTTTAPVVETSTSTSATASPESNVAASGGVTIPGFGGFALVSAVAAVWAIGFV